MTEVNHRFVEANGIKMHVAEQGDGPLVRPGPGRGTGDHRGP